MQLVRFQRTSTRERLQPDVQSNVYDVVSNAYNNFVADQMKCPGTVAYEAYQNMIKGKPVIVRQFNNDTEILLFPQGD